MASAADAARTDTGMVSMPRRGPSALAYPLVLLAIVAGFYWKLVFTYQFDWMWSPDLANQILPWWQEAARQLHSGHFPLWDTHSWMGQPFLAQAQPGAAYPLNWILWAMPFERGTIAIWAIQWYFVAVHYLAALFAYLLCRDLGRSRAASLIGGLAFALVGYIASIDWPQMLNGAIWTPVAFLFLLRAVRGKRPWASAALSGACIGMAWLSGHHQAPIFLTLAAGCAWIYYVFRDRRPDWRMARLAIPGIGLAPIVGAFQILPAQEFGRLALRWAEAREPLRWGQAVPYFVHAKHSLHPIHLFGLVIPGLGEDADPFAGVVVLSLAILGVLFVWRHPAVKFFSALAGAALIYSLGADSIFQGLIYAIVPFVEKARAPSMAIFLFQAATAALAAFGVDALLEIHKSPELDPWVLRRWNAAIAAFAAAAGSVVLGIFIVRRYQWDVDDRIVIEVLVALLLAALIYAWRRHSVSRNQAAALLTLLFLFEAGSAASSKFADRNDPDSRKYLDRIRGNADIAQFLHQQQGQFRVASETEEIPANWGDFFDIDFPSAQTGVTVNAFRLQMNTRHTQDLVGTRFTLSRAPSDPAQHEAFRAASGIAVYENPGAFPRAWTVHGLIPIRTVAAGQAFIQDHVDQLQSNALYMGNDAPRLEACPDSSDKLYMLQYTPTAVLMNAVMTCAGMVVLSDTVYPGWQVFVDGRPARIYEVDMAFRGVLVGKGLHGITYQYRPKSVYWGAGMSITGLLGAAVLAAASGRKHNFVPKHH